MTEDQEDAIYNAQEAWLREHYPDAEANMGWFVDYILGVVITKVYGHGILSTGIDLNHTFEEFST